MKIAIFHLGFFYSGGGEKLILEEIRGLRNLGHDVACYAPYIDRVNCFPDVPEMKEIIPLLPPPPSWLPFRDALWLALSCIIVPFRALNFRSFDIFLGANQPGPWFAWVLARILRKPYIIYLSQPLRILHPRQVDLENGLRIREGDARFLDLIRRTFGWLIDWADRRSVHGAEIMLSDGEYVSTWLREVYGRHDWVCPAGCYPIPSDELSYANRWDGKLPVNGNAVEKPFVLVSNRHAPHKRFEYALWAMKRISREAPNLSLVVTGQETSYTDQLRYLVDGLGLQEKVQFVGLVSEEDLARLYQEAAVYIYPSPEEDFGMGIIESMAAGTPVVAWNNGGPTGTVLDGETGFLIEPYDTEEYAQKILRLAASPTLVEQMGRAANDWARKRFSYQSHNRLLEAALETAIETYDRKVSRADAPMPSYETVHRLDLEDAHPILEIDEVLIPGERR